MEKSFQKSKVGPI